ncbi:hypothetical protein STEG23_000715, partial [Scotinomys teguina]
EVQFQPEYFHSTIICERPNNHLSKFNGYMEHPDQTRTGFGSESLLLRGCTIRNTEVAAGIVIYAGHETKAMLNNSGPRYKRSKIERRINRDVFFCIGLLFLMCLIGAVGHSLWNGTFKEHPPFDVPDVDGNFLSLGLGGFYMFLTMIILLQEKDVTPDKNLLSKVRDAALWLETSDTRLPKPSHSTAASIADFFLALTICNSVMVSTTTEPRKRVTTPPSNKALGTSLEKIQQLFQRLKLLSLSQSFSSTAPSDTDLGESLGPTMPTTDSDDKDDASVCSGDCSTDGGYRSSTWEQGDILGSESGASLEEGLEAPALSLDGPELCYEAESPDEAALVHAARAYSFTLVSRTPEQVTVRLPQGICLTFDLLFTLGFDSVRKRMSVVVRHPLTGEIIVYTKGADSVIMDLLEDPSCVSDIDVEKKLKRIQARTQKHLDLYARDGLRTLCIAKKVVNEEDFQRWASFRREAEASLDNREELLMETAQHLENHLTLLGATGIEDRLQEGVPDTIAALREAGIQLWVLTGDKQETAVNIAYSCKLLDQTDTVYSINTENKETCESILNCALEDIKRFHEPQQPAQKFCGCHMPSTMSSVHSRAMAPKVGLVVDGKTLNTIFQGKLENKFLELTQYCRSVLCCRSTPLQKSMIVKLVRDKLNVMTLSIGDGANDVSMIQAADIGIGISGQEGMQAVMSSDFAIARFSHLKKLLLVHGHWCYSRLARMVVYYFYKNVCYVNLLFWYQFFCGFSGSTMIDYWQMIFFNLFFTSLPPIAFGILDKDVSAETLLALPELYKSGQNSECYNLPVFWMSMADAFYQSLICFFIPYLTYRGSDIDVFTFGTPINTISLTTILLHQAIEMKTWTVLHGLVLLGSFLMYFVVSLVYNATCVTCNSPTNPYWVMERQLSDPTFYLTCFLTPVVALLPRYFLLSLQGTFGESLISKAQKIDKLPIDKRNLEIENWRSKQRPTPASASAPAPASDPAPAQPPCHPVPPTQQQDLGTSTPKNSSPSRQKHTEDCVLQNPRCSRELSRDDTCSGDSLAKLSSGECLLGPNRTMAPTAYTRGQKDVSRHSSKGSHRRSQSSLTI